MAFVEDDELIILMDTPMVSGRMLSLDELKRLRDIGIRTAFWAGPEWDQFMRPDKSLNWTYFDDYLGRMKAAGMKCLIPLWCKYSMRYPAKYYVRIISDGVKRYRFGIFSPWNREAMSECNRLLEKVRDRITSEMCQVVSGWMLGGEKVLLNRPAYYDNYALADWNREHDGEPDHTTEEGAAWLKDTYVRLMIEQQKIMVNSQHKEVWFMLSRYKGMTDRVQCSGCEWIDVYLDEWQKLEPKSINHISFNYFPYGPEFYPVIQNEKNNYSVNEFVGAEYAEGLRDGNGKVAIDQGLRLIVGPTHSLTRHKGLEDWMIDEMRKSINYFQNIKSNREGV